MKKKGIKRVIPWIVLGILALLLALLPVMARESAETAEASVLTTAAVSGEIKDDLAGGGMLTAEDPVKVEVPEGIEIAEFLVENGDHVEEGQAIAKVDRVTLMAALLNVQTSLEDVSDDMQAAAETTTAAAEAAYTPPKGDLGGRTFNILMRYNAIWTPKDVWAEHETGDMLNDAVYRRNLKIEDEYNVKLFAKAASSDMPDASLPPYIKSIILSGENAYDLYMFRVSDAAALACDGLFVDLLGLESLDFTQDFWQYDKLMETTIAGRLYYATGLAVNAANALNICYFNKDMAEDYKLANLYDVVNDGAFTFDYYAGESRKVARDLDGDGKMTAVDQFGVASQNGATAARMLYYASGEKIIAKDKDDIPYIRIGNDRSFAVYGKVAELLSQTDHYFQGPTDEMKAMFFGERSLFYLASMSNCEAMRVYDFNFGLLPLPKYDEEQEEYYCYLNAHNPCGTTIPVTANAGESALILQAIACYSVEEVIPTYYDICLTNKYLRDDESAAMLDIIYGSWNSELADAFPFGGLASKILSGMATGAGLSSTLDSIRATAEGEIEKTVEAFRSFE